MANTKNSDLKQVIPINIFDKCLIDGASLIEISKKYTRTDLKKKSCYVLDKFEFHIKNKYNLSIRDYIIKYKLYNWPICPVSKELVGYRIDGNGVILSTFKRGKIRREFCKALDEGYKRLSKKRKGKGNPMFGIPCWNKGLTKETNASLKSAAEKQKYRITSEETKKKQSIVRKLSPKKSRHNKPHSEETKELLRKSTARLWAEGIFSKTTSIHVKMREFLKTLSLQESFIEEYQVKYFSMDFAFPLAKVAIECQGSYYHIDPRIYPNGPINEMQRRNFGRDKAKRKICCEQEGWIIIEAWEPEINDNSFKEQILCRLKELNLLKN
jgi:hypothetical protein